MTRLHLVRHGPTHAKGMVGWSDLPADLSDMRAVARLTAFLPEDAVIVSSDLKRCVATAQAIADDRPMLPPQDALREIHFGEWELRRHSEITETHPETSRAFWSTPGDVRPPGGETWNEMRARVDPAIDALIAAHEGRDIIVVGHFGMILGQVQRARGVTPREALGQKIDNLSVTEITWSPDGWTVGRVSHLP
ncbi:histidine phosphatase family protein [Chachezhania sediminis]|uniref:histidine phosphatase family protein n=1 Tax=Chachezhania sediminis TaxID=2599291 RepID=UPI00131B2B24|nr:histidine phosphatase family protein [Chachezhania sediminis]